MVAQHVRAGRRRSDHRLGAVEDAGEAPRKGGPLASVAGVEVHLPTVRLLEWEVDLASEPLQQPHHRPAGVGEERVVEAGDEQARPHAIGVYRG